MATGAGSGSWPEAFAIFRCLSPSLNPVSSFRHVVRSMRISRTTHSCPLHAKGYVTYQTGSAFNRSCFIQPPPTPPLPAEPYASGFALAYSLRLRSCRLMGAFVISPLPPFPPEELQAAGSLRSTGVAPLPRYYKPHRHPLVLDRLPGVSGYTAYLAAADFAAGRGGLLQLRDASCVTVLSLPPRRSDEPSQPGYGPSCCLRLSVAGSTSECPHFRGHIRDCGRNPHC